MNLYRNNELFRSACYFAGVMCLLSLFVPMLSFATVVRYAAVVVAVWGVAIAFAQRSYFSLVKLVAAAAVMNPFIPPVLDPLVVRVCTVVSAVIFFAAAIRLRAECLPESLTPPHAEEPE